MTPMLPTLNLQFRRGAAQLVSIETQFHELFALREFVAHWSPLLAQWFLSSTTSREDALKQLAFDAEGPAAGALEAVRSKSRGITDIRSIALWNGAAAAADGATLVSTTNAVGRPDIVSLGWAIHPAVTDWAPCAALVAKAVTIWPAAFVTFGPFWHTKHRVFKDRPGVGWMLYLPRVLTPQDVPEAAALVPVAAAGPRPAGTIIVSVTNGPFSDDNPDHVAAANAIETRLVDQDLLPRYAEL